MTTPTNPFKAALAAKRAQIGYWLSLSSAYSTEICATAGFDWLLVDGEHGPMDLNTVLMQLQIISAYPNSQAVVRVPDDNPARLKQVLDVGAQTVLVPMVDTAEQAAAVVAACRYPQDDGLGGIRGMAGGRASRWGMYSDYFHAANREVCVLVQAETRTALNNLDAIAATPGVDGVFIGPADLSASMGHVGDAGHPEVLAAIDDAMARIIAAGKAPGILTQDNALAQRYLEAGALFVAVGLDTASLAKAVRSQAQAFGRAAAGAHASPGATGPY
jgi:4-hydroxy-2-oxoheptanedioate aldolase